MEEEIRYKTIWVHSGGGCSACSAMKGTEYDKNPGDVSMHPNCGCTADPVEIETEEEDLEFDATGRMINPAESEERKVKKTFGEKASFKDVNKMKNDFEFHRAVAKTSAFEGGFNDLKNKEKLALYEKFKTTFGKNKYEKEKNFDEKIKMDFASLEKYKTKITNGEIIKKTYPNKSKIKNITYREINPKAGENIANYMVKKMNDNFKSVKKNSLALPEFNNKVTDDGEWDYKKRLQNEITFGLKVKIKDKDRNGDAIQPPTNYNSSKGTLHYVSSIKGGKDIVVDHDLWSNIHYGYVGKANKNSEWILKNGSRVNDLFKWRIDSKDTEAVKLGFELYDKYGAKGKELTPEILKQEIIKNKNKLNVYSK